MIACRPWRIAPFGQNSWQQKQWMQTTRSICGFFFFIVIALAGFSFTLSLLPYGSLYPRGGRE